MAMNVEEWDQYIRAMPSVQTETNYGYRFYFVGEDHRLAFATIAETGNEHERISALDRPGVFRLNIGIRRETFVTLFPDGEREQQTSIDYTALNVFMPHPDYAKMSFICILNPDGENIERTRGYLAEAHALLAAKRASPP